MQGFPVYGIPVLKEIRPSGPYAKTKLHIHS